MKKSSMVILLLSFTMIVFAQQRSTVKTPPVKLAEQSADVPSGKFVGSLFSDYLYILQEPQLANPSAGTDGRYGLMFRRATIGYEYSYNKDVSAKIVYDANSNVLQQGFAEVHNLLPMTDLKIGLSQTLSSETVDKLWEYRSLEATVLDRKGMTNEFDMGLTLSGRANAQGTMYAHLAIYNGNGSIGANDDKQKKIALSIGNWFDKSSLAELYVDFENVGGLQSTITAKAFYGMMATKSMFGVEGFYRMNRKFAGTSDVVPAGASLFGWYEIMKMTRAVVRVDVVDDDLNVSATGYREIYFNGALDYSPVPDVHLIPNIAYVKNLKKGSGPEIVDYMMVRLTTAVNIK